MIYWYHVLVCVLDLHFKLEWPSLGRNDQVYITVPRCATFTKLTPTVGAAVAEWLSSWLAEHEDRGSIPGPATWIFRDLLFPASKSRYGWKIAKSTLILKTTNQLHQLFILSWSTNVTWWFVSLTYFLLFSDQGTMAIVGPLRLFQSQWCLVELKFTFIIYCVLFCALKHIRYTYIELQ